MTQTGAPSILVVDDTPANLTLLAKILTESGYAVRVAPNGKLALQSACAQPPDLALLDIRMSEMDGYTVCKALKSNPQTADIPVIFLSALTSSQDKLLCFEAGAVDYIAKPFDAPEVLARVATHLRLHALQAELEYKNAALLAANEALEQLATTDPLTGLLNRRALQQKAAISLSCTKRYGTPYSVILFDLDHFKSINDKMGHDAGDTVLKAVSQRVLGALRDSDTLARWGGEEFLVLATQSGPEETCQVAERLRQLLADEPVASVGRISASFGVAGNHDGATLEQIIQKADTAMYAAKQQGRNRVVCAVTK